MFIGGPGADALVMGAIDRDANNIPVIVPATGRYKQTGLPTADVTGQNGFCTLEDVRDQDLGYDFLVRFFVKSTGALAVTIRVAEVEQVFCTSQTAAAITFADLRDANPAFVEVSARGGCRAQRDGRPDHPLIPGARPIRRRGVGASPRRAARLFPR